MISIFVVSKSWPEFHPPYLSSVHASAITCLSHICDLEPGMMDTLAQMAAVRPGEAGAGAWSG